MPIRECNVYGKKLVKTSQCNLYKKKTELITIWSSIHHAKVAPYLLCLSLSHLFTNHFFLVPLLIEWKFRFRSVCHIQYFSGSSPERSELRNSVKRYYSLVMLKVIRDLTCSRENKQYSPMEEVQSVNYNHNLLYDAIGLVSA